MQRARRQDYNSDYEWGKAREIECLPQIRDFFNPELKITKKTYAPYDYWAKGLRVELKSRTNSRTAYNCTLISLTKVEFAKGKPKIDSYFVFDFKDAYSLYYIKYDEKLFKTFKITEKIRLDRGKLEKNYYVNIPIYKLKEM